MKLDADTLLSQVFHQDLRVFQATGEMVYGVNMQPVTSSQMSQTGFQLRPIGIFAAAMVFKVGFQLNTIKLAAGVLINAANPDVSNVLAFHVTASLYISFE